MTPAPLPPAAEARVREAIDDLTYAERKLGEASMNERRVWIKERNDEYANLLHTVRAIVGEAVQAERERWAEQMNHAAGHTVRTGDMVAIDKGHWATLAEMALVALPTSPRPHAAGEG